MTSEEIKQLRLSLNLTQEDFAAKLGVTLSTVSRWESGLSVPSPLADEKLVKLQKSQKNVASENIK